MVVMKPSCLISKNHGLKSHTWYLTLNSKRIHASEQTLNSQRNQAKCPFDFNKKY